MYPPLVIGRGFMDSFILYCVKWGLYMILLPRKIGIPSMPNYISEDCWTVKLQKLNH
jgi:hypothetical protein